ncbi:MAG: VWA domain-containing protein [Ramlibacter sp.]|nr:VWA domain-containing protein [Ramlibacter sp.]
MSAEERAAPETGATDISPAADATAAEPAVADAAGVTGTMEAPVVPEAVAESAQGVAEPAQNAPAPTTRAKTKGVADIVFLIDVSGSMASCIDALRKNIEVFIDSLNRGDANNAAPVCDWRGKVVGYRGIEAAKDDGLPWIHDHPFVRDAASLKVQLSSLQAAGGGDEPESCWTRSTRWRRWKPSPRVRKARMRPGGATAATRRASWLCSPMPPSRKR